MLADFNVKADGSVLRTQARMSADEFRRHYGGSWTCECFAMLTVNLTGRSVESANSMKHPVEQIHEHPELVGKRQEIADHRQGSDNE